VREACVPCGEHEQVEGEACVCEPGFVRADEQSPCEPAVVPEVNFGASCGSDAECTGPGATCITDDVIGASTTPRAGYCSTRDCESVADCPADEGFGCYPGKSGSFCRLPPSGEGDACDMAEGTESNPACTEEASACALGLCTAPEPCSSDASCTPGLICCDLSVAQICTPAANCPSR
jgi:hypothetical protein